MGDYLASHDLEDLMAVVNGRPELTDEMSNASPDVQNYVGAEFRELLDTPAFLEAVPGHLSPDDASQARAPLLRERLERIASLT